MHHIYHTTQIRTPTLPPCIVRVNNQIMQDVYVLAIGNFGQLHSIQQRLVNTISNAASKRSRVVVFLYLPNRYGVDRRSERAIDAARQSPNWRSIPSNGGKASRIVVTRQSLGVSFNQHVYNARQICRGSFFLLLLVHGYRAFGIESPVQVFELSLRAICIHQARLNVFIQYFRTIIKIGKDCAPHVCWSVSRKQVFRAQFTSGVSCDDFSGRWDSDGSFVSNCISNCFAN